jgi:hypothetical protein
MREYIPETDNNNPFISSDTPISPIIPIISVVQIPANKD